MTPKTLLYDVVFINDDSITVAKDFELDSSHLNCG